MAGNIAYLYTQDTLANREPGLAIAELTCGRCFHGLFATHEERQFQALMHSLPGRTEQ